MDCSLPGCSVHGIWISQARIPEWVAISFSRGIFPTQGSNSPFLCLLHCRRILYLLSHWGSLFWTLHINGLHCDELLLLNTVKLLGFIHVYQDFIPFCCLIIFRFIDMQYFIHEFMDLWAIVNNAAMNIHLLHMLSFLLGLYLGVELLAYMVTMLTILRNCET